MKDFTRKLNITDAELGASFENGARQVGAFIAVFITAYVVVAETLGRINEFLELAVAGWTGNTDMFETQPEPQMVLAPVAATPVVVEPVTAEPMVAEPVIKPAKPKARKRPSAKGFQ